MEHFDQIRKLNDELGDLNDWECGFVSDIFARIEKYGDGTKFTEKQIERIKIIFDKHFAKKVED
jgi:hypothetical protein